MALGPSIISDRINPIRHHHHCFGDYVQKPGDIKFRHRTLHLFLVPPLGDQANMESDLGAFWK